MEEVRLRLVLRPRRRVRVQLLLLLGWERMCWVSLCWEGWGRFCFERREHFMRNYGFFLRSIGLERDMLVYCHLERFCGE